MCGNAGRGELGSTKSQIESMRREMLLHKQCAPLPPSLDTACNHALDLSIVYCVSLGCATAWKLPLRCPNTACNHF